MPYIYCFTFPNNKKYIGFAKKNYKHRWSVHKHIAKKDNNNTKLYNAIRKYGWNNIEKTILEEHEDSEYTLKILENKYINLYNTINNGYNTIPGGKFYPVMFGENNPSYKRKGKKINEYFSKEQIINHSTSVSNAVSGSKNKHAKKIKIISPKGEEYFIYGTLMGFCKEHNISFSQMYKAYNEKYYIVPLISNKANKISHLEQRKNTIGWSIYPDN